MTTVRDFSSKVQTMREPWRMIDALLGGTFAMRAAGETFLPRWPQESVEAYEARRQTSVLYPAFSHTVSVLAGKPFSKLLSFSDDTPARLAEWFGDDADLQGRNLHVFASDVMTDVIGHGISGVLVEYPWVAAGEIRTREQELRAGLRPYFTRYPPGTVLGWRSVTEGGASRLAQVRLLELLTGQDGEFGEVEVEQVRVVEPGRWRTFRRSSARSGAWEMVAEGRSAERIPFVFFYSNRIAEGLSAPPLLELAHQNVEHWQSASDQRTILHVARVPILFARMLGNGTPLVVGANTAVEANDPAADLKFVEHSGSAIAAGAADLLALEERMRATGAELLVLKPGATTATQVRSESEANRSTLQKIVETTEDSWDQCLALAAAMVGEPRSGSVRLFKDFGSATLAEASSELLLKANQAGRLSDETFFAELKRRGIVSPDATWIDEQERLQAQGPAPGDEE